MQCLQVELVCGLRGHELHRRPLHRLGDRLGITEVVLSRTRFVGHDKHGSIVLRRNFQAKAPRHDPGPEYQWALANIDRSNRLYCFLAKRAA
jgi:hypothetical protein